MHLCEWFLTFSLMLVWNARTIKTSSLSLLFPVCAILGTVLSAPVLIVLTHTCSETHNKWLLGQACNYLYEFPISLFCSLWHGYSKIVSAFMTMIPIGFSIPQPSNLNCFALTNSPQPSLGQLRSSSLVISQVLKSQFCHILLSLFLCFVSPQWTSEADTTYRQAATYLTYYIQNFWLSVSLWIYCCPNLNFSEFA